MLSSIYLLIAAAFLVAAILCAFVVHAFARIEALERKIRHLHRKQDEERRIRQDYRNPRVRKVAR